MLARPARLSVRPTDQQRCEAPQKIPAQRSDATIAACVEELLGLADETTRRECAQHSPNGITEGIVCSYTTFTVCDAPWAAAHTDKGDAQDTTTGMRLGLIVVVDM